MGLHELSVGDEAKILKVIAVEPFRSRLFALGLNSGEQVTVLAHTLGKNTYEVKVNSTRIALRREEAEMIAVDREVIEED
ncbi:MAG: ferrous iron transport protein A [Epsilonproteobacteria bacterium]|nr:ferrous iron transport protein A [Campylobacterota bacterium]